MFKIENRSRIIVLCFFAVIFIIGMMAFKDYGIAWDGPAARYRGELSVNYVISGDKALYGFAGRFHGPIFEIFLYSIEKAFGLSDDLRAVYLMRHLCVFLMFYIGLIFFYFLCKDRLNSWKMGILGCMFMVFTPRIFAHSFYNSKDIVFMSVFIISVFTLIKYLDNKTFWTAAIHALICSILIDIRILGSIIPCLTVLFLLFDLVVNKAEKENAPKCIKTLFLYVLLLLPLVVLFWPLLWPNPLHYFVETLKTMAKYPFPYKILYFGDYFRSQELPWHYAPFWILMTTPVLYSTGFLAGVYAAGASFIKNIKDNYRIGRNDLIFGIWFFLPLSAIIIGRSNLYDSWRHLFFIYPAFLIFSVRGFGFIYGSFRKKYGESAFNIINRWFAFLILCSIVTTGSFMIKYHPYQNVYFNLLAGKNMRSVKESFELDYWGLSFRKALEYILDNDRNESIKVFVSNISGWANSHIIKESDRKRLIYVDNIDDADYFLSNYRWHKEGYPLGKEYYAIKVGNANIMVVYKLDKDAAGF